MFCKNKTISNENTNNIIINIEKLDSVLVNGVLETVEANESYNLNIPSKAGLVTITFLVDTALVTTYFSDSTVCIDYNLFSINDIANIVNYKGVLNIDGINVAIFDKGNFGEQYYNIDSLDYIPLNHFKRYPSNNVYLSMLYYVVDGKLYYWNP